MTGLARAFGFAALLLAAPLLAAEPVTVTASPLARFKGVETGARVDSVIWRGGFVMSADHPEFGGLSSLGFLDHERLVMVTDEGRFVSGRLVSEDGTPRGLADVEIEIVRNSSGNPLPNKFSSDSEALDVVFRDGAPVAVRVGFEHLTRVADFDLVDGRPGGAARPVAIPDWLTGLRTNESIESLCVAPPASPVAGSTLLITEGHSRERGAWAATLLGNRDRGDLGLIVAPGFNPTDCAFLPDGDLLILERGIFFLAFTMQVRRIPADEVRAGALMDGPVILSASGGDVGNMEGLGVRVTPEGETRLTIVSDDNFNGFLRTILLEFGLQ